MDAIWFALVLILIVVFLLPIILAWNSNNRLGLLLNEFRLMKQTLLELRKTVDEFRKEELQPPTDSSLNRQAGLSQVVSQQSAGSHPPQPQPAPEPLTEKPPVPVPEVPQPVEPEPLSPDPVPLPVPEMPEPVLPSPSPAPPPVPAARKELKPLTNKRKTGFEQFIGEKLISLVGIAILVLGIFFTVKWAIGRNLITDAGKILIGLASATILLGIAHKLSRNYRAFSSILAGGGIAVLYFSMYQAYQSYHLLPQAVAFAAMVLITLLAVILSVLYNKVELAIIGLLGGFATPFFVSNGSGNYQILFSYMLILNIGMFVLALFKRWNLLNIIGYASTVLIFFLWTWNSYDGSVAQQRGGFLFACLFYLVFFATLLIYNIRHKKQFVVVEILMLLSNSFFFLAAGLFFLHPYQQGSLQGIFVISLAVFNFIITWWVYRRQEVDRKLVFVLIALVLTFASLAGPVQLDGNYITLFWACETLILYWLGVKAGIPLVRNASMGLLVLTLISLGMDWENSYSMAQVKPLPVLLNKAFITGLVVITALYLKMRWVQKDTGTHLLWGQLPVSTYLELIRWTWMILIYMVGVRELYYQSYRFTNLSSFQYTLSFAWHFFFLSAALVYHMYSDQKKHMEALVLIGAVSLLFYPMANFYIVHLRGVILADNTVLSLFKWHYLLPVFALALLGFIIHYMTRYFKESEGRFKLFSWFLVTVCCFIISAEVCHTWIIASYQPGFGTLEASQKAVKVGWPIVWSVLSLALMWAGMKYRIAVWRIISLTLFSITILKLFVNDISNVSQGGKIAAFICLGVILLIVSFMYQRIRGLFADEKNLDS